MEKEVVSQFQEAQRVPYKINPRKNMPRHLLIKRTKSKHKEKIFDEIMVKHFPKMGKEIPTQVQEA